jgi:glyoxylase-like metal-dependent hydrolase (beta-lactamase superfamily II)
VSSALDIPIYIHEEGKKYITNPIWNLSVSCGKNISFETTNLVQDNELIELEDNKRMGLKAIHVKGHTLDGLVFYNSTEGIAFVGDSIFAGSIGRSDFYGGNYWELISGIKNRILSLPDNTILYSGHSKPTTVSSEKKFFV